MSTEAAFYVAGGTLAPDAPSYLPRAADVELLDALTVGELCYILNARQMGKSSLCLRTRQALTARGIRTVFLDLQKFGSSATPEQWFNSILQRIGLDLRLRSEMLTYWRENAERAPLDRLFGAITEVALAAQETPLVIFLDEVDVVRSLPFAADEFFGAIRESFNERATNPDLRRLTFCLVGSALQADLVADTRLSPFNVGRQLDLRDFTLVELAPLAAEFGGGGNALIERVHHWTNGHPFLTQSVCAAVVAAGASATEGVDRVVADAFFTRTARRDVVHLADVSNRMLSRKAGEIDPADDRQKADILALYEQLWRGKKPTLDDARNPLVGLLKLSGIVSADAGVLKVRNRIYERVFDAAWIAESRPDAEARRQRQAVARARWQVGSVAFAILLAMGSLTAFAVQNARRADRERANALASARAEGAAKTDAEAERGVAQRQAEAALRAKNDALAATEKAQTALKGESLAKASAQRNELLSRSSASVAAREKRRAEAQTRIAEMNANGATRLNYDLCSSLVQRAMDGNQYDLAQTYLDEMTNLQQRNPGLKEGFEATWFRQQMHPERMQITGHKGGVLIVAYSPDGSRLLTGGIDGTARIWDARTGRETARLIGHPANVYAANFSPDGKQVVTDGGDDTNRVWDASTGKEIVTARIIRKDQRFPLYFHGRSRFLCRSPDIISLSVCDSATGATLFELKGHTGTISNFVISADETRIVTMSFDRTIRLWDAATGKQLWSAPSLPIIASSATFSPDGKQIAFAIDNGFANTDITLDLRDSADGKSLRQLKGQAGPIVSIAYSRDGHEIVSGSGDGTAVVWNADTGEVQYKLKGHLGAIHSAVFSPDGDRVATAGADGTLRIWDALPANDHLQLRPSVVPGSTLTSILSASFSQDGKRAVTRGFDNMPRIWDTGSGKELMRIDIPQVYAPGSGTIGSPIAVFSPVGRQFMTGGGIDSVTRIWDANTGRERLRLLGHGIFSRSCAWSADGKHIFTAGNDKIGHIWDTATGRELLRLKNRTHAIVDAAFSPDGKRIVTSEESESSGDGLAGSEWDAKTGRELLPLPLHNAAITTLMYSPDSKVILASCSDDTARLLDAVSGKVLLQLRGHNKSVTSSVFSPDGGRIATGSDDGTTRIWDSQTGREMMCISPPEPSRPDSSSVQTRATSVAFSPDGKDLITAYSNGIARIWKRRPIEVADQQLRERHEDEEIAELAKTPVDSISSAAEVLAAKLPNRRSDIGMALNDIAFPMVDPEKSHATRNEFPVARKIAETSVRLTQRKNGDALDTLAAAYLGINDRQGAIETEAEAVVRSAGATDRLTIEHNLESIYIDTAKFRDPDRWASVEKNITIALDKRPELGQLRLIRAGIRMLRGSDREAQTDFVLLARQFPVANNPWACLWPNLIVGDTAPYRQFMLARLHGVTPGSKSASEAAVLDRRAAQVANLLPDYTLLLATGERAVEDADKRAGKPAEGDDFIYQSYGAVLLRAGRAAEATQQLLRAARLKPDRIWTMYFLALAYAQTGDKLAARQWYDKSETCLTTQFDAEMPGPENWSAQLQALLLRREVRQALRLESAK